MTNEELAVSILQRHGYIVSAALDEDNYREIKDTFVRALNLIDAGRHREAMKCVEPFNEGLREEVTDLIVKKGQKN